jgi:hypothetical protein
MTHFTVLAVAKDQDDLFNKMLPYAEYGVSEDIDENGKWHGKATAGWWGSEKDVNDNYYDEWKEFVHRVMQQDLTLYILDCHV